jgi:hypothetical protein
MTTPSSDNEPHTRPADGAAQLKSPAEGRLRRLWSWIKHVAGFDRPEHDGPWIKLPLEDTDANKEARAAAVGAATAHVLSRPDSIRQRAQHAATIASAFAAGLVIAGVSQLAGVGEEFEPFTILSAFLAIGLWALSGSMFVYAIVAVDKAQVKPDKAQVKTPEELGELIQEYERYADRVRQKMRRAAFLSAPALFFTVLAVMAEIVELRHSGDKQMRLVLTADGASRVRRLCNWERFPRLEYVEGLLPADRLAEPFVSIEDVTGQFGNERDAVASDPVACSSGRTVRLARSAVAAALELPESR